MRRPAKWWLAALILKSSVVFWLAACALVASSIGCHNAGPVATPHPGDAEVVLSRQALVRNDVSAALSHALKALELEPRSGEASRLAGWAYLSLCVESDGLNKDACDQAQTHSAGGVRDDVTSFQAKIVLAMALVAEKRYSNAKRILLPLVHGTSDDRKAIIAWRVMGLAELGDGEASGAIVAFRQVLDLDPRDCTALNGLKVAHELNGATGDSDRTPSCGANEKWSRLGRQLIESHP
jgi:hypothetical protein